MVQRRTGRCPERAVLLLWCFYNKRGLGDIGLWRIAAEPKTHRCDVCVVRVGPEHVEHFPAELRSHPSHLRVSAAGEGGQEEAHGLLDAPAEGVLAQDGDHLDAEGGLGDGRRGARARVAEDCEGGECFFLRERGGKGRAVVRPSSASSGKAE